MANTKPRAARTKVNWRSAMSEAASKPAVASAKAARPQIFIHAGIVINGSFRPLLAPIRK